MPKFQNIVGTGFPDFIQDQINIISEKLYNPQLTGSEVRELSKKKKKLKKDMSKLQRRLDNINEQKQL